MPQYISKLSILQVLPTFFSCMLSSSSLTTLPPPPFRPIMPLLYFVYVCCDVPLVKGQFGSTVCVVVGGGGRWRGRSKMNLNTRNQAFWWNTSNFHANPLGMRSEKYLNFWNCRTFIPATFQCFAFWKALLHLLVIWVNTNKGKIHALSLYPLQSQKW